MWIKPHAHHLETPATQPHPLHHQGGRIALDVKAGDLILFGKYSGQEIKLDGEEYLIMREDEVLAVIDSGSGKKK
jgi:chaperonin GroES